MSDCKKCDLTRRVGFGSIHLWTLWFSSTSLVLVPGCDSCVCVWTCVVLYFSHYFTSVLLPFVSLFRPALYVHSFSLWMLSTTGPSCSGPTFLLQVVADLRAGFFGSWLAADSIGAFSWWCCCSSSTTPEGGWDPHLSPLLLSFPFCLV